jgi:hypothetical protein
MKKKKKKLVLSFSKPVNFFSSTDTHASEEQRYEPPEEDINGDEKHDSDEKGKDDDAGKASNHDVDHDNHVDEVNGDDGGEKSTTVQFGPGSPTRQWLDSTRRQRQSIACRKWLALRSDCAWTSMGWHSQPPTVMPRPSR